MTMITILTAADRISLWIEAMEDDGPGYVVPGFESLDVVRHGDCAIVWDESGKIVLQHSSIETIAEGIDKIMADAGESVTRYIDRYSEASHAPLDESSATDLVSGFYVKTDKGEFSHSYEVPMEISWSRSFLASMTKGHVMRAGKHYAGEADYYAA